MRIKNGNVFTAGSFQKMDLEFSRTITALGTLSGPGDLDAAGCYVIPGLVDIHTHGAVGEDFSDGKPQGLRPLADYYAAHGVTSFLATTMTLKEHQLTPAMEAIRDFRAEGTARCAGIHLEGPFLSYAKRGAQAAENLHKPDAALLHRLDGASGGLVRLVTVAPEEEGAMDFIREASKLCTVSLGHTTADYDTAMAAFDAGATHATHLFNAMPSFLRLFGDKLNLISDSLRCAGMPDGGYELGGQPIVVKDHKATLLDGTIAGSSISLMDAVRNVVKFGLPLEAAVYAASTAPAQAAKLQGIGSIEAGNLADLVVLDQELNIKAVFIDGQKIA